MKKTMKKTFILMIVFILFLNNIMLGNISSAEGTKEGNELISRIKVFCIQRIEDNEYIKQQYSVNYKDGATSYSIEISNFPEGTIVTDTSFKEITELKEDTFNILMPRENVIEDINGVITVNGEVFKYEKSTKTNSVTLKTRNLSGEAIKNQSILLRKSGEVINEGVTNENGEITFNELYPGRYSAVMKDEKGELIEKSATSFILLHLENPKISVVYDKPKENNGIVIENEKKKGKFEIAVVDKANDNKPMENIEIEVLDEEKKVVDAITTNAEGKAISKGLPVNKKYFIKQKTVVENYTMDQYDREWVFGENGEVHSILFKNEMKKNVIKITKVDKDDNNIKLGGVTFEILDEQNNVIETITTNKEGIATSSSLPINKTYKIKETKTQSNYVLDETVITIWLTENGSERKSIKEEETQKLSSRTMDYLIIENQRIYNRLPKFGC